MPVATTSAIVMPCCPPSTQPSARKRPVIAAIRMAVRA